MYASYNSCGSSAYDAHLIFDSSALHTFHARNVTTVSASSFIIVITIGFVGLLMICAGSSSYYRRRAVRNLVLPASQRITRDTWKAVPRLWDMPVERWQGQTSGYSEQWRSMQPLAMRIAPDNDTSLPTAPPRGWKRNSRWCGGRSRNVSWLAEKPDTEVDPVQEADVVVLVSMPGSPPTPHSPHSGKHDVMSSEFRPAEDHSWSKYAVGVAQVSVHGDCEKGRI